MGRQRGQILLYLVLGIAFIGVLAGLYFKVHGDGVSQGKAEITAKWEAANRKAEEAAAVRRAAAKLTADTAAAELAASQQKGRDYEAKWRIERAKVRDSTLAACSGSPVGDATTGQATLPLPASNGAPVRFSWQFVRLWDRAWTGQSSESVFPDRIAPSGADAGSLSPVGPGEVLDNHAENASRCSTDRRAFNSLIIQIEQLKSGWK